MAQDWQNWQNGRNVQNGRWKEFIEAIALHTCILLLLEIYNKMTMNGVKNAWQMRDKKTQGSFYDIGHFPIEQ